MKRGKYFIRSQDEGTSRDIRYDVTVMTDVIVSKFMYITADDFLWGWGGGYPSMTQLTNTSAGSDKRAVLNQRD